MPGRYMPLTDGEIYHICNKGIDHRITFADKIEYKRALLVINFYRFDALPLKLSSLLRLPVEDRENIMTKIVNTHQKLVEILSFCLMPNHFHFLLKQLLPNGISRFMSNFQNSFTRYFNVKNERVGPLFLDQFKAVRIENEEQLLHTSRYIHLNPYTSFVVKTLTALENYPWSSLPEYLNDNRFQKSICAKELILSSFKENKDLYMEFIYDQADYQRELDKIKHLILE